MRYRAEKLQNYKITKLQNSSRGYILITLMLFMTLIAMAALAVLPDMVQQIKRDREEEMVHRGTEYMRAIKKYYKKFGRYPTRIEELENTNQQRFLRKRYKDPMGKAEQDFKLIHVGDPVLNNLGMGGIGVGQGLNPNAGPGTGPRPGQILGQTGNQPNFVAAPGGGVRPAGPDDANAPQATGLPGQQGSGTTNPPSSDAENSETAVDAKSSGSSAALGGQVFGGGPIVGVASTSKAKSIRVFNKKDHYNEWVFLYDPRLDRAGGLLKGPVQPDSTGGMGMGMNPGGAAPGQPGRSPQPTGQPAPQQPEPPDEQ